MKRILLLAATMTLALVLVGGVAISKQPPPTIDKGSGSIPRSTVVKASFASGSGFDFLGVKVSYPVAPQGVGPRVAGWPTGGLRWPRRLRRLQPRRRPG